MTDVGDGGNGTDDETAVMALTAMVLVIVAQVRHPAERKRCSIRRSAKGAASGGAQKVRHPAERKRCSIRRSAKGAASGGALKVRHPAERKRRSIRRSANGCEAAGARDDWLDGQKMAAMTLASSAYSCGAAGARAGRLQMAAMTVDGSIKAKCDHMHVIALTSPSPDPAMGGTAGELMHAIAFNSPSPDPAMGGTAGE